MYTPQEAYSIKKAINFISNNDNLFMKHGAFKEELAVEVITNTVEKVALPVQKYTGIINSLEVLFRKVNSVLKNSKPNMEDQLLQVALRNVVRTKGVGGESMEHFFVNKQTILDVAKQSVKRHAQLAPDSASAVELKLKIDDWLKSSTSFRDTLLSELSKVKRKIPKEATKAMFQPRKPSNPLADLSPSMWVRKFGASKKTMSPLLKKMQREDHAGRTINKNWRKRESSIASEAPHKDGIVKFTTTEKTSMPKLRKYINHPMDSVLNKKFMSAALKTLDPAANPATEKSYQALRKATSEATKKRTAHQARSEAMQKLKTELEKFLK